MGFCPVGFCPDTMWNSTFHSVGEGELVALLDVGDALGPLLKEVDSVKQLHDDLTALGANQLSPVGFR